MHLKDKLIFFRILLVSLVTFIVKPFLPQVVIQGSDDIASRAIDLLKEIYTNLGPKLQVNQVLLFLYGFVMKYFKHF